MSKQITLTMKPGTKRRSKNLATSMQDSKTGKIAVEGKGKNVGRPVARRTGRGAGVMTSGKKPETQFTSKKNYPKTITQAEALVGKRKASKFLKLLGRMSFPLALGQIGVELTKDKVEQFKNIKELERGKMRKTVEGITRTPAEQKRDAEKKVPRPKKKPKPPSPPKKKSKPESNKIPDADVFISGNVTIDKTAIPKAYGGKVVKRNKGKKVGRGCGAAMRGGGAVMKS